MKMLFNNKGEVMINLYKALLLVQGEIGAITKDSKNPFFKSSYLSLNGVREAIMPVLTKNKILLTQPTVYTEGKTFVATRLSHSESGETMESLTEVVCSKPGDAQNFGSGLSYSRRYGLMSLLCLAAEDDDGESSVGRKPTPTVKTTEPLTKNVSSADVAAVVPEILVKKKVSFSKKAVTASDEL